MPFRRHPPLPEKLMLDFLQGLFSSNFMPHGYCYQWDPGIVWLHAASDSLIAISYYSIPFLLLYFARRRKDLEFKWMFILFGAFILLCGTTHLLEVWTIWKGTYRLTGVVKLMTGVVSAATAILLMPVVPRALELPSPSLLREINAKLKKEIAERQRAQDELKRRADELDLANRRLVEAEKLKDEFFANVSHELRTPLTLILSPVESLLTGDRFAAMTEEEQAALRTVHNNATRLLQMVTGILDFSKAEAKRIDVQPQPTDIGALTRTVLSDFGPLVHQKKLHAELALEPALPTLGVDRYLFERILFNLISNAVKFTPEEGQVDVRLGYEDGQVRLIVKDTGIGIAPEDMGLLFEKFRQVEGSSNRRFEGTGLGLALVKQFAELLGGNVWVQSRLGEGSTFTVAFPAEKAALTPEESAADESFQRTRIQQHAVKNREVLQRAEKHSDLPRVLVAEDNPELGFYVLDLLNKTCQTRLAADGNEALQLAQDWKPDLLISDIMMPGIDGFELCRRIKDDPQTASLPVVLVTALANRQSLLRGWEAGADEYLFKPFHPVELVTRVRSLLASSKNRLEREQAVRRSEAWYHHMFSESVLPQAVHSERGQIRDVNQAFCDLSGYDRDTLTGMTVPSVIQSIRTKTPEHGGNGNADLAQVNSKVIRKDGEERLTVQFTGVVLIQSEPEPVRLSQIVDVTDVYRAREALDASQLLLSTVMGAALEGILVFQKQNDDNETLAAALMNPSAERMLGVEEANVSHEDARSAEWLPEAVRIALDRTVSTGQPVVQEVQIPGGDDALTLRAAVVRVENGAALTLTDISERARYEKVLAASNEALRMRNVALNEFTYVASHDLQEPLRKIRAFADLLQEDFAAQLPEEGRHYVERMQESAGRMSTLITDLLSYSRVLTRSKPPVPVDLNETSRNILADLEIAIKEADASVQMDDLPTLEGDPTQFRQLLQNLVGNALKFRRKDVPPAIKVWSEDAPPMPDGRAAIRLFVQDNGIGFDEKYSDRIFAPFQRLHGRAAFPGTGMGLAICRRIVERHGGNIVVRSRPGEGTTFTVTLPLHQLPEQPASIEGAVVPDDMDTP